MKHADCKTIILDKNYRSLEKIIKASNSLIKKNANRVDKSLSPMRTGNGSAIYFHAINQQEESNWIANQIISLREQNVDINEVAILYRAHFLSRNIEEIFVKNNIPYVLFSGVEFYRRKEIKDVLCYLRLVLNGDDISFLRVINEPKRGIGDKRIKLLKDYANDHSCTLLDSLANNLNNELLIKTGASEFHSLIQNLKLSINKIGISDLVNRILEESNYEKTIREIGDEDRLNNIAELKQSIFDFETNSGEKVTLEDYLQHIALFTNIDRVDNKNTVKMMTIHSSKGLEFPYVFICGLNEGIFPSRKCDTPEKLEEERRLAYVAFTRAKDRLFLSESEGINYDGTYRYPSRFIFNTEKVNLDYLVELKQELIDDATDYIASDEKKMTSKPLLNINDRIHHSIFGEGQIVSIDMEKSCYSVKFDRLSTPRNILFWTDLKQVKPDP